MGWVKIGLVMVAVVQVGAQLIEVAQFIEVGAEFAEFVRALVETRV